jgi:hypothetical protein
MNYLLKIPFNTKLEIYHINKIKVVLLTKNALTSYLAIPTLIFFSKSNSLLYLKLLIKTRILSAFCNKILQFIKVFNAGLKKKLKLQGLGLKVNLSETKSSLIFKLGYSHLISVPVPTELINVTIKKNLLIFTSIKTIELGNFCHKICLLKKPNAYKGKGIWFKGAVQTLKIIKKA